jgi:hypothetical protein
MPSRWSTARRGGVLKESVSIASYVSGARRKSVQSVQVVVVAEYRIEIAGGDICSILLEVHPIET